MMPMPVQIRGVTYASAKEAAFALNVSVSTVYSMVSRGTADRCGLGRGAKRGPVKGGRKPIPIVIGGMKFESLAAASLALGRGHRYVQKVLSAGGEQARTNLLQSAMKIVAQQEKEKAAAKLRAEEEGIPKRQGGKRKPKNAHR